MSVARAQRRVMVYDPAVLQDLHIRNFRCFENLTLSGLGHVNLIVGRNNVGKSSVLDALRIYLSNASVGVLRDLLIDRDEISTDATEDGDDSDSRLRIESLFHGWTATIGSAGAIQVGPSQGDSLLSISIVRLRRSRPTSPDQLLYEEVTDTDGVEDSRTVLGLRVGVNADNRLTLLDTAMRERNYPRYAMEAPWARPAFVPSRGLTASDVARAWDAVALREGEQRVIDCLRMIEPVQRITLLSRSLRGNIRVPWVLTESGTEPVPLRSLGDGMMRIFQFALAAEIAAQPAPTAGDDRVQRRLPAFSGDVPKPAALLIDEIENGIHYTALEDLWKFIFGAARLHNLQVFATSHSWDCIDAFRRVAVNDELAGMLFRIERHNDTIKSVDINESDLEFLTRNRIEVR